jgi:hypothetical protein
VLDDGRSSRYSRQSGWVVPVTKSVRSMRLLVVTVCNC